MKNQATLDALVEMEDEDLIILFERLSTHIADRERSFRTALRSALFPQRRLRKHQDKLGGCRQFVAERGFITLHHAKESKLVDEKTASATWLRCFVRPLVEDGVIEEYPRRWKGPNTRGTGMKVYNRPGTIPSIFGPQTLVGYSLVDDAEKCSRIFIDKILSNNSHMRTGFPLDKQLETALQNTKSRGKPVFRDVTDETIRNWLEATVKPMLTDKKEEDPRYQVYHVHGSKISVTVGGHSE
jgi:hypothetical protein